MRMRLREIQGREEVSERGPWVFVVAVQGGPRKWSQEDQKWRRDAGRKGKLELRDADAFEWSWKARRGQRTI